jgi:hypothetical protein
MPLAAVEMIGHFTKQRHIRGATKNRSGTQGSAAVMFSGCRAEKFTAIQQVISS